MAPRNLGTSGTPASKSLFHAGGLEAEVEEVFRRVSRRARSLDDVEIVVRARRLSRPLIWEKALRYDWPVTLADGIAGRADATGPRARRVRRVDRRRLRGRPAAASCSSPATSRLRRRTTCAQSRRAARLLVKAEAAWGRETYRFALGRLATRPRRAPNATTCRSRRTRAALNSNADAGRRARCAGSGTLIAAVPLPERRTAPSTCRRSSRARRDFVDEHAPRGRARSTTPLPTALGDALGELEAARRLPLLAQRGAAVSSASASKSCTVGADRPRPGHLFVSTLQRRRLSPPPPRLRRRSRGRPRVPAAFEDPILLDAERGEGRRPRSRSRATASTRPCTPPSAGSPRRRRARTRTSCLSYSCRDLREFRPDLRVVADAAGVSRGVRQRRAKSYGDLHDRSRTYRSRASRRRRTARSASRRWWLHGLTQAGAPGPPGRARRTTRRSPPACAAAEARASTDVHRVRRPRSGGGRRSRSRAARRVVSPTQLEEAADCPFRYFLEARPER